ncbi:hypothetical protein C4D60_Mb10t25610 [Musa balbisiana]|uniref:Phytocyanin domain-containing protein n=1 Tax=Musa balbisiana TaxID=52838 RepID=A0A4S8IZP3_MUSBA|nr:hypothetical protein C4D60_Mb10t25610 [Musa balbisiana]
MLRFCGLPLSSMAAASHLFFFLSVSLLLSFTLSAYEFRVGGTKGWTKPTGDELENYNHWATKNRFHIGDSLCKLSLSLYSIKIVLLARITFDSSFLDELSDFKYENDSVLVVDKNAYKECDTKAPLLKFVGGNTTFTFDRHGYFYFISGEPGNCKAGERLIIRVMVHWEVVISGDAPSPQPGHSGSSISSAAVGFATSFKNTVFMAALGSTFAISQFV